MDNKRENRNYISELQGLRAIAVILVVIFHAGLGVFHGGYIGVDAFFVISGYLITGLLFKEYEKTGQIGLVQFYARRIRRLLPAATFVLLATSFAAWLFYSPMELKQYTSSALATAVYLSNIWFASLSTDYLAEDTDVNPLLHTWSLSVEEQFYLVWPLLIILFSRGLVGNLFYRRMLLVMATLSITSLIASLLLTRYNQPWAFFSSPTRAWEFGIGGVMAIWAAGGKKLAASTATFASIAGIIILLLASTIFDAKTQFPGFAALLPVLGTCLVIGSFQTTSAITFNGFLRAKPMQYIGDISYSLYLWHWPVSIFIGMLWPDQLPAKFLGIAVSFLLASLTFIFIENPFRFGTYFKRGQVRSLALGASLFGISAILALSLRGMSVNELQTPAQQRYLFAKNDLPVVYAEKCHADFTQIEFSDCVYGDRGAAKTIVLFGDSHAAQWFPALDELARQNKYRLVSLTKSGCPSVSVPTFLVKLNRPYTECAAWREKVFQRIQQIKPELVVLSNYDGPIDKWVSPEAWQTGLRKTLSGVRQYAGRIVVIRDTPELGYDPATCLSRASWKGKPPSACRFSVNNARSAQASQMEIKALDQIENGMHVDMSGIICPDAACPIENEQAVLFKDSHHLTATYSRLLASRLQAMIHNAGPESNDSLTLKTTDTNSDQDNSRL